MTSSYYHDVDNQNDKTNNTANNMNCSVTVVVAIIR